MIKKVNHIGIVVKNLEETMRTYNRILGKKPDIRDENAEVGAKIAYYRVGDTMLEFIEGSSKNWVPAFIEAHGEGIHHISLEVDDIAGELKKLDADGVKIQDKKPQLKPGYKFAFVGPEGAAGVTYEIVQPVESENGSK